MIDWPIVASNGFMATAIVAMIAAPLVGIAGGWRALSNFALIGLALILTASFGVLAFSWRAIPGGVAAATFGHLALIVSIGALAEIGRLGRSMFFDRLVAAMASVTASVAIVGGIFAMAPLTENVSRMTSDVLLLANPLVAVTTAAGIDLFHIETIYRTSPLAHRGVELPAWTTACAVYAVAGLAAYGASRIRPRSQSL